MKKLYYSISEISKIVDEESHILRYWEKEFSELRPKKNKGGNRIYSENDVKTILTIQKLIRDEKLSLKDAKIKIKTISNLELELPFEIEEKAIPKETTIETPKIPTPNSNPNIAMLKEFKDLLLSIKDRL